MDVLVIIGLSVALAILGWQDMKDRRISIIVLLFVLLISSIYQIQHSGLLMLLSRILVNTALSLAILVSGTLIVKLRRPEKGFSSFIGTGDFLFLISISPIFSFESYMVFLYTSFILILLTFSIYKLIKKQNKVISIPLAGAQAIYLLGILIANEFIAKNITSISLDHFLL